MNSKKQEKSTENIHILEISGVKNTSCAKIHLDQGGSLQELILNGHELVKDMYPLAYSSTYASSILFPFANRIKDGLYKFNNETFQLDINEKELNNAIHGLVYNKTFKILSTERGGDFAKVVLIYQENSQSIGFPYNYNILVEYMLTECTLSLKVEIKNTDIKTFPFTLGWHPYFLSSDLYNSSISFNSNKKLKFDKRNIMESVVQFENTDQLKIKEKSLDDCYILNTNNVIFSTPKYELKLNTSEKESFLQLYRPPHHNTIAIEPTTGVSDSFNNGIGLKTLKSQETYNIEWSLELMDN